MLLTKPIKMKRFCLQTKKKTSHIFKMTEFFVAGMSPKGGIAAIALLKEIE
jgi:hypothetical protein